MGRRSLVVCLLLVAGFVTFGWYEFNAGVEIPLPFLSFLPKKPATKASEPPPVAEASSKSGGARYGVDEYRKIIDAKALEWRSLMLAKCEASDTSVHPETYDVDGDAVAERVCWQVVRAGPLGTYLEVAAKARRLGGKVQTAYRLLAMDDWDGSPMTPDGGQPLLCNPHQVKLGRYVWRASDAHMFELGNHKPVAIRIDTGSGCDPSFLFWPSGQTSADVDFDMETDAAG